MREFHHYPSKIWREWLAAVEPSQTRIANVTMQTGQYVTFRSYHTTNGKWISPDPNLFGIARKAQLGIIDGPGASVRWM